MSEYAHPELLAEPDWLQANLDNPNVRVIDCATVEAYRRAHIAGAVQLPVHYYIKENDPEGSDHGTLVMPPREFEDLMSKLGVSNDTTVVTYDDNNGLVAARLWWVLKYYGHTNAKVLNGGWHRWMTEGRPATFHATKAPKGDASPRKPNPDLYASVDYLKEQHANPGARCSMPARTASGTAPTTAATSAPAACPGAPPGMGPLRRHRRLPQVPAGGRDPVAAERRRDRTRQADDHLLPGRHPRGSRRLCDGTARLRQRPRLRRLDARVGEPRRHAAYPYELARRTDAECRRPTTRKARGIRGPSGIFGGLMFRRREQPALPLAPGARNAGALQP